MAQATNINERPRTFTAPPAIALVVVLAMSFVVVAALFLADFSTTVATVQPRSEAVLESGRAWQRQYEQISGIEARRQAYDAAVLQSGLDWEQRYKEMTGN